MSETSLARPALARPALPASLGIWLHSECGRLPDSSNLDTGLQTFTGAAAAFSSSLASRPLAQNMLLRCAASWGQAADMQLGTFPLALSPQLHSDMLPKCGPHQGPTLLPCQVLQKVLWSRSEKLEGKLLTQPGLTGRLPHNLTLPAHSLR